MGNWEFCSPGCRVDFKQQMASRDDLMGPWRLEHRQASKILPTSHDRYERSIVKYLDYLKRNKCNPDTWEEHEDLMVEYKSEKLRQRLGFIAVERLEGPSCRGRESAPAFAETHTRGEERW